MAAVTYPRHAATVAWALKQVGQHEIPMGSNRGPFVQFCQSASWLAGTGFAWCRTYVLRAHLMGGFELPDRSAGAWDALDRARSRGDARTPAQVLSLIPGDEVIWAFGAGHSSIFLSYENGIVTSVDGNVGDSVEVCHRPLGEVRGFIHWRETGVAVPVKKPRVQVVGSISGRRKLVTRKGHVIPLPKKRLSKIRGRNAYGAGHGLGGSYARHG